MKFSVQVNKSFNNICKHCGKPAAFLSLEDEIKNNKSYFQKVDKSYIMPLGDYCEERNRIIDLGVSITPMYSQSAILFNSHVKTDKKKLNLSVKRHSSLRKYYWVAVCPCYKTEWKVSHSSDQTASYFKCNSLNDIYAKSKKLRKFTY
jgi:hypothetical protein